METFGKDVLLGRLRDRYPWAHISAANAQLGLLVRGMSDGEIRPSAPDAIRMHEALDELAKQVVMLRHLLSERTKPNN